MSDDIRRLTEEMTASTNDLIESQIRPLRQQHECFECKQAASRIYLEGMHQLTLSLLREEITSEESKTQRKELERQLNSACKEICGNTKRNWFQRLIAWRPKRKN